MSNPHDFNEIADATSYRVQPTAAYVLPGALSVQNVNGVLCQVDDLGNVTAIIGGGGGGLSAITGDVVATGPGVVTSTIQPNVVTYAKIQKVVANNVFLANIAGASSTVQEITAASARTLLGLAAIATSGSASDLVSGTVAAARLSFGGAPPKIATTGAAGALGTISDAGHTHAQDLLAYTPSLVGMQASGVVQQTYASTTATPSTLTMGAGQIPFGFNSGTGLLDQTAKLRWNGSSLSINDGLTPTVSAGTLSGSALGLRGTSAATTFTANSDTPGNRTGFTSNRSRGTSAAPTTLVAGDTIGSWLINTYGTGGFSNGIAQMLWTAGYTGGSTVYANWAVQLGTSAGTGVLQTLACVAGVTANDVVLGPNFVTAPTDTTGFVYLPITTTIPTGVPALSTEMGSSVPVKFFGTNKLAAYLSGAWHYVTFDDGSVTSAITSLTGDVTATGPGAVAATIAAGAVTTSKIAALNVTTALIAANAITYAKIQTQADQTLLGNVSGGTAVPSALTKTQVSTFLALTTTYQPLITATATDILFGGGGSTVSTDGAFTFNTSTKLLTLGTAAGGSFKLTASAHAGGLLIGGSAYVAQYITDTLGSGEASLAVDDFYFGQALIGFSNSSLSDLYVGTGTGNTLHLSYGMTRTNSNNDAVTIDGTSGAITLVKDVTASGAFTSGSVSFPVAATTVCLTTAANGNVRLGSNAALATNATNGFPQIPRIAGRPTGTPTLPFTQGAPVAYNSTDPALEVYDVIAGGWLPIPAFSSTAGAGAQVGALTNMPAAILSTTTKYWTFKDSAGVACYVPFWQ